MGSIQKWQSKIFAKLLNNNNSGIIAEKIATLYLIWQGLYFVTSRFNCNLGEIDIIMREKDTIVFVEVRYRKNTYFGSGAASITNAKQQKIIKSALYYANKYQYNNIRIDVISMSGQIYYPKITWLKNAIIANN